MNATVDIKSATRIPDQTHSVYINGIETFGLKAGIIDGYGCTIATRDDNKVISEVWDSSMKQIDRINKVCNYVAYLIETDQLIVRIEEGRQRAILA